MRNSFHLLLYDALPAVHVAAPKFTYDITNFTSFTTQLHGGFGNASATIYGDRLEIKKLFDQLLGYHAIIVDRFYRIMFEGRISSLSAVEYELQLKMTGYYADASTIIDDRIYPTSPIYLSEIIEDSIDLVASWRRRDSNYWTALYNLAVTDPDTGGVLALDFTDLKVQDALERCLAYGYNSSDYRMPYFAIWQGRYADIVLKPPVTTSIPDWMITRENVLDSPPSYSIDISEVFNSIYAVYANSAEGSSKTTAALDTNSIDRFGLREGVVQNGSNPEGLALGTALRDYAIDEFAWPKISSAITVEGKIFSWGGNIEDNYMIRAGDVVYVDLGDPNSIVFENSSPEVAAKTKMFVMATNYSASNNTNTLTIGNLDSDFTVLMSRLGLSGGLR